MTHFVLLGAGFSRAVHDSMPLLPELATSVLSALNLPSETLEPFDHNLEQWLSYLSSDQPWLEDSVNLRNRAQFYEASEAVRECVEQAESQVTEPPFWLQRLVHEWCSTEAVIVTFNYDLLVERTASMLGLVSTWYDLYGVPLELRQAPSRGLTYGYEAAPGPSCTILKLHGSVNWAYGGLDAPPSDRIVLAKEWRWWAPPVVDSESPNGSRLDDLQPLIVPPTGAKGLYYSNRSLRGQWKQALRSLQAATSVSIIGYSFPATDLATRHLLSTARITAPVTVVDRAAHVARTVERLAPRSAVASHVGASAVADFVSASCGDLVSIRAEDRGGRYIPEMLVNGPAQTLGSVPGAFDDMLPGHHERSAEHWARQQARDRFPKLKDSRWYQARRGADTSAWSDSYTRR